jgi:8-oxo-dGTP pyrophosphatase MutT (NUDIX family)
VSCTSSRRSSAAIAISSWCVRRGLGEELYWTVPAGRVEPGEFVTEALVREVREETGIAVLDPGSLAFTIQVDDRKDRFFASVWTWDVKAWEGEVGPIDPDEFVHEAAWHPLIEALSHLDQAAWHPLTVRYLRGDLEPGRLWLRRVHEDGLEELLGPFG